jgi:hypothetical protein
LAVSKYLLKDWGGGGERNNEYQEKIPGKKAYFIGTGGVWGLERNKSRNEL